MSATAALALQVLETRLPSIRSPSRFWIETRPKIQRYATATSHRYQATEHRKTSSSTFPAFWHQERKDQKTVFSKRVNSFVLETFWGRILWFPHMRALKKDRLDRENYLASENTRRSY